MQLEAHVGSSQKNYALLSENHAFTSKIVQHQTTHYFLCAVESTDQLDISVVYPTSQLHCNKIRVHSEDIVFR